MEWSDGVVSALHERPETSIALVIHNSKESTEENIEKAIESEDHARLCIIALDEGVVGALKYMNRMSAGVTEELIACFRDIDLYDDGATHLLLSAEPKINNFSVAMCGKIDDDGVAATLSKNIIHHLEKDDIAGFGVVCGNTIPELED
jgi:hypothetical protein